LSRILAITIVEILFFPLDKFLAALAAGRSLGFAATYAGEVVMVWAYAAAAALGVLLGLRFKAGALIAASVALIFIGTAAGPFAGWSVVSAFGSAFLAAFALQCGYLGGLLFMCAAVRARTWPRYLRRHVRSFGLALGGARARAR
jgi:hypothetical protein